MSVVRMEYAGNKRRAEIDHMNDCEWRVWLSNGIQTQTLWRRSLTSAQSAASSFIALGNFSYGVTDQRRKEPT
jgi:hypothetical protein